MPHPIPLRAWLTVAGLLCASLLRAQAPVWRVSHDQNVIYLGGTCHILRPQDFPLPKEFDAAFAAVGALYFETDLARLSQPETQQQLIALGTFTDGKALDQVLDASAWQAVQNYCNRTGMPVQQVKSLRPWFFAVMITVLELQKAGVTQEGVDLHYLTRGKSEGKMTSGLEQFDQHLEFIVNMGAGHESEMVLSTIEDLAEIPRVIGSVIDAWRVGDLAKVDELMLHDMRTKYPSIYEQLMVSRNRAWLPKIEELLRTPKPEFVLVGFGHLAGDEGLVAQLKKRGYRVEAYTHGS